MLSTADQAQWTAFREAQLVTGVTPEMNRRDQVQKVRFYTHFNALNEKILNRQKSLFRGYFMTWLRSALYYDGKQVLVPRGSGFGYEIVQLRGIDHPLYVYNRLRPYSDEVTSMWVQSSPEVMFAVLDSDNRKAERISYEIEILNSHFDRLHLTEENLELIAKGGQFCGNYHFETWFDENADNGIEWFENYRPLQVDQSVWYDCLDCGDTDVMSDNQRCQQCGSRALSATMMNGVDVPGAIKSEEGWKRAGEIVGRPFPAWSQRWSLTTGPSDSPYRYAEEDIPREMIEYQYGKLDGTSDDERWGMDESMHPERVMRRAARQRVGYEYGEDDTDNVLSQRFWYEPEMLCNFALIEPEKLPDGTVIPANERLSDVFPEGVCIMTAPGFPRFLRVDQESHKDRWTDGRYGITFGQQAGHGIEDGVEAQRQRNVLKSGTFRYLQKTLQPSVAVNGRVFKNPQLFNRLDNVISIPHSGLPQGTTVGNHFAFVTPPAINPQVMQHAAEMDAEIQAALKSYNSSGDFAGVQNDTATAAKIGVAKQASAHNLYLALYAGFSKELSVKRLRLAQKHYKSLRLVHDIDSLTGDRRAREISNISISANFIAWVKTGSFMPNLQMERRAQFMEAANAVMILQKGQLLNPASLRKINEIFQVDFSFDRQREKLDECEEIVDQMLTIAAIGPTTPQELYALFPVDEYTLGHDIKIHWYRDYLGSPEGRTAPAEVQAAIKMRIQAHYAALVSEDQMKTLAAQAGQILLGQMQQMTAQPAVPPPAGLPADPAEMGAAPTGEPELAPTDNPMMIEPQTGAAPPMTGRPM